MKKYVLKPVAGASSYRISYERELNPQQLEVVMAGDGPMLVIAGAGSGKTRTLTYRVARLVESGVPMENILLLTFTNKAAREMLRRVEVLLGTELRILGGTFHHVGNVVLRRYAGLVGLKSNFTILDREDSADIVGDIIKNFGYVRFPKADVILDTLSYALNTETSFDRVVTQKLPLFRAATDEMVRVTNAYTARKRELNFVDFDDLLMTWRDLLGRHDSVREEAHARWPYVLVDEYQDTNRLQADICEMITGPDGNLMVVGDDAQSIYSFRGANFGNIIDFPKRFPSARMFKLETNYRSTPQILALANSSIACNARQFDKVLRADRPCGPLPERVVCGTATEQARFVVQRVLELRDEGVELRDQAVLYRAHWHAMELQMELTQRNIPFQVRSGLRFFEQAHIKDVSAYLRILVNPRDEVAWKRVTRLYSGVGNVAASQIWEAVAKEQEPFSPAALKRVSEGLSRRARAGWEECVALLAKLASPGGGRVPSEMIHGILEGGYEEYLQKQYLNWAGRVEDVQRLADFAMRFKDVQDFLAELALTTNVAGAVEEAPETDYLVLTSVHQAKGLEWRAVFGIWLVDGKLPDGRALAERGGEEEERRLFYVMCTRAKEYLYLVHPVVGDERGMRGVVQRASRFLTELDRETYETVQLTHEVGPSPAPERPMDRDPYVDGYGNQDA